GPCVRLLIRALLGSDVSRTVEADPVVHCLPRAAVLYPLSLHAALPLCAGYPLRALGSRCAGRPLSSLWSRCAGSSCRSLRPLRTGRKCSTPRACRAVLCYATPYRGTHIRLLTRAPPAAGVSRPVAAAPV